MGCGVVGLYPEGRDGGGVPALEAEHVSKTYDRVRWVLEDVSLTVEPGELVVLMGRSGSGKTTLLNMMAGLETPTEGSIRVDGTDLSTLEETERTRIRREEIGIVFQRFHLLPELTVQENVALPMRLADRADADERAAELLEFFGLGSHLDAFPATLSGGETQRAALARALGNEPAIVLADEPTASLDEDNALNALDALRRVVEELNTAVLAATHDPITEDAGDRVVDLVDGRIVQDGDAREVPSFELASGEGSSAEARG